MPHRRHVPARASPLHHHGLNALGIPWGPPSKKGYGEVKPATIFNGGDPTGLVTDTAWLSWGGGTATGIRRLRIHCAPGQITADGKEAGAAVVAFDLGIRDGKRMHQKIEWFFS